MASTTALLTGLSGLISNSRKLDIIGNNIANANTPAFKSNRILFAPTFSRTLSAGTSPSATSGGSNPTQVGLGVSVAGTQRNFSSGAISTTGVPTDLAIEGAGFFIVERGDQQYYTRKGAFQLNSQRELVSANGERVQGYAVDDQFNIVDGTLGDVEIPLGSLTVAEATENVIFAGNLNAGGAVHDAGSESAFDQLFLTTAAAPMTAASTLVSLQDPGAAPGTALLPVANVPFTLTLQGVQKGGQTLPTATLNIDATTDVQDLIDFINTAVGIVPGVVNPDGRTSGAQIDALGRFSVVGNTGEANNIIIDNVDLRFMDNAGAVVPNPFTITQTTNGDGESVRTSFVVYDSLGTPIDVDITMVLEGTGATGTTWRYYVESADNITNPPSGRAVANGVVTFDTFGRLSTSTPINIQIGRDGTGAENPLGVTFALSSAGNNVTALTNVTGESTLAAVFQDGSPLGTLANFSVGADGIVSGAFTNGLSRTIGRVAIATFSKPEGLVDIGNDLFAVGPNSGTPLVTNPGQFGTGRIVGGALEQSNVDLGQEFIDLVLTSSGYSAASRIISTTDQLLQQLIALGR